MENQKEDSDEMYNSGRQSSHLPNGFPSGITPIIKIPSGTPVSGGPQQISALARYQKMQQDERKTKALRRWKKIRDRLKEVKDL